MSESTGKGHQVPDSTSLSTRLATEYNETTVPGTSEIAPSTTEPTGTTIALGGQVEDTMVSQKQSVCGPLSSPAESGDVPRPLVLRGRLVTCDWRVHSETKLQGSEAQTRTCEWGRECVEEIHWYGLARSPGGSIKRAHVPEVLYR